MNKCNQCGHMFVVPDEETIMHYEVDTRREETFPVCPECGSEEFEEVSLCPGCRNAMISSGEDYCQTCIDDATWCIDQIQRLIGCDWEMANKLVRYVIDKED